VAILNEVLTTNLRIYTRADFNRAGELPVRDENDA